jgi:hypothetical protein
LSGSSGRAPSGLRAEDVGAEGKSSPSSLKGSRGAREAASIIWRSSLGRVVGAYGASASADTQAVPHRTGSAAASETALNVRPVTLLGRRPVATPESPEIDQTALARGSMRPAFTGTPPCA